MRSRPRKPPRGRGRCTTRSGARTAPVRPGPIPYGAAVGAGVEMPVDTGGGSVPSVGDAVGGVVGGDRGPGRRTGERRRELVAELARLLAHLLGGLALPGRPDRPPDQESDRDEDGPQPPAVREVADERDPDDDEQRDAPAVAVQRRLGEDLAVLVGQQRPGEEVGEPADPADEEQDDEDATDDERVDPQPVRDAGAHAGEPAVVGVAAHAEAAQGLEDAVEPGPGGGGGRRSGIGHGTHAGRGGRP